MSAKKPPSRYERVAKRLASKNGATPRRKKAIREAGKAPSRNKFI